MDYIDTPIGLVEIQGCREMTGFAEDLLREEHPFNVISRLPRGEKTFIVFLMGEKEVAAYEIKHIPYSHMITKVVKLFPDPPAIPHRRTRY